MALTRQNRRPPAPPARPALAAAGSTSPELAEEIYRLVCQSRRALWVTATRALEARRESVFAWQVVSWVVRNGPTTQRALSQVLAQHPAGVSRQVDELEAQGLVRRRTVADRRRLLVSATSKGRRWYLTVSAEVMAAVDTALGGLDNPQRQALLALLRGLLETVARPSKSAPYSQKPFPTRRGGEPLGFD